MKDLWKEVSSNIMVFEKRYVPKMFVSLRELQVANAAYEEQYGFVPIHWKELEEKLEKIEERLGSYLFIQFTDELNVDAASS